MAEETDDRKLFVGGLSQEVNDDDLKEHFEQFGAIEESKLMKDPTTERSRGFGFITYESAESLNTAVSSAPHSIKGKEVTAKKAVGKSGKVYIGKIPEDGPTEAVIRDQLSQFGTIAEVERPVDRSLGNKPKDFFFVTFEKESVAKKLLEAGTITVEGIEMMVKPVNNNKGQQHKSGRKPSGSCPSPRPASARSPRRIT